jgi:hypothetical protein
MHMLKLLALLAVFSVAPAAAGHCGRGQCVAGAQPRHHSACPYQRAREEAAAAAEAAAEPVSASAPTTITLTERVPAGSSLDAPSGMFTP